jgi:L-alanine-DL-glutamate epimerase-like enolase superfamily enzyme
MKITSIQVSLHNLELTRPYTISYKTVREVENVIVMLRLENGMTGYGSANPSKQVVNEDVQETLHVLNPASLETFLGRDIREFHGLLDLVSQNFANSPGARAALDIALHDAFCQYLGVPVAGFLGQKINSLPTSITIGIKNVQQTLEEAAEYYGRGFRVLKIKLGSSAEEDLERLQRLREMYGARVMIRVDANQGYSSNQLIKFFDKTKSLQLELIEQPLPAGATADMKQLPSNIRRIIAADESLIGPDEAFRLADSPAACGIFNIKLMKCGGITPALQISTIAQSAGIHLMWGCNDESIISITAALHAAFSCENTRYIDLDGSLDLARDVVAGGFILDQGSMSINGKPGLGISPLSG